MYNTGGVRIFWGKSEGSLNELNFGLKNETAKYERGKHIIEVAPDGNIKIAITNSQPEDSATYYCDNSLYSSTPEQVLVVVLGR